MGREAGVGDRERAEEGIKEGAEREEGQMMGEFAPRS